MTNDQLSFITYLLTILAISMYYYAWRYSIKHWYEHFKEKEKNG